MKITIKNKEEINKMRIAGIVFCTSVMYLKHMSSSSPVETPGITYGVIISRTSAANLPANVGYRGYEKTICSSVNQVICHGIPDKNKILKNGDILNIDVTVIKDGWHGDTSKMFLIGKCQPHNERLVKVTQECLYKAIKLVKPGAYLGDIGHIIQKHAESNYYSVVEDYCGHGIGTVYHEEPQVLHYGTPNTGVQLKEGMCFTIEPMINQGSKYSKSLSDGWTVETKDGRNSAQWEHTLAVTSDGVEVLTKRSEESI